MTMTQTQRRMVYGLWWVAVTLVMAPLAIIFPVWCPEENCALRNTLFVVAGSVGITGAVLGIMADYLIDKHLDS